MLYRFSNNYTSVLSADLLSTDTVVSLQSVTGFPAANFAEESVLLTLEDASKSKIEIVKVTGLTGNNCTILRGQEGTVAQDFVTNDTASNRLTAEAINTKADNTNIPNWDTAYSWGDHALVGYELASNKGIASGYASLDIGGKVPSTQLPSYVDDVLEYTNQTAFPASGEAGKIYVALDTNKVYRWSGTAYIEISSSAVNSVNGATGNVVLGTDEISEGVTNLYYTDTRARASISTSGDLSYNATTGVLSFSETYSTAAEVKTAYESNLDTNAYSDAEKTKLGGIATGAEVNTVDSVNTKTGAVVLGTDDISEGVINLYYTTARANTDIDARVTKTYVDALGIDVTPSYTLKSAAFTAVASGWYTLDVSTAGFTITLNATPTTGDVINFLLVAGDVTVNSITISRNTQTIEGLAEDMTVNTNKPRAFSLYFNGTTWRVFT